MAYRNYGPENGFVVNKNGQGDFTTISAAVAVATSGTTIFLNPGIYTENFTLPAGVNLAAFTGDAFTPNVTIVGKITFTALGTSSISGIELQTNSDFFLVLSGSNASKLNLVNCFLNCSNNTGISYTNSSSSSDIHVYYSFVEIGTTGIAIYSMSSPGQITFIDCDMDNVGGTSTANSNSAGLVVYVNCLIKNPISCSSTGTAALNYCDINTGSQNATSITASGTSSIATTYCSLESGTASCINSGAGCTVTAATAEMNSSNVNTTTGAGTLFYGNVVFTGSTSNLNCGTNTAYAHAP